MGKRVQGRYAVVLFFVLFIMVFGMAVIWYNGFMGRQCDKRIVCDLNGDGVEEVICLSDNHMTVSHEKAVLWESEPEWEVTDFLVGDMDRDGSRELLVLLWKKGSFGEYTPFWKENDEEYSQHIYIYRMSENKIRAVWMSSRLKPQIQSWNMTKDSLIHIITDSGEDTDWMWGQWGLERVR